MKQTADVVICGAGIAGVAAAHFLSKAGVRNILLLDERPPLSFTSDSSTECYRNGWPDPEMLADRSGNIFRMNRRGYLYLMADEKELRTWKAPPTGLQIWAPVPCVFTRLDHYTINHLLKKGFTISPQVQIYCSEMN